MLISCTTLPLQHSTNERPIISNLRFEPPITKANEKNYLVFDYEERGNSLVAVHSQWSIPERGWSDFHTRKISDFARLGHIKQEKTIKMLLGITRPATIFVTVWIEDKAGNKSNKLDGILHVKD